MFLKSRLVHFTFATVFLAAGLAGAYVRCLDAWPAFEDGSVAVTSGSANPNSGERVLHCPVDWHAYRIVQVQHSLKKDPRTERVNRQRSEVLSWMVAVFPGLAHDSVHGSKPPRLSTFLYPSIAIYQSKVVYRI